MICDQLDRECGQGCAVVELPAKIVSGIHVLLDAIVLVVHGCSGGQALPGRKRVEELGELLGTPESVVDRT